MRLQQAAEELLARGSTLASTKTAARPAKASWLTAPGALDSGYPLGWESLVGVPSPTIELRLTPDTRVTAFRLAA